MKRYLITYAILIAIYIGITCGEVHVLPNVFQIKESLSRLINQSQLGIHLLITFQLFFSGVCISILISTFFACLFALKPFKPFVEFISKLRFLPPIGFTFFAAAFITNSAYIQIIMLVFFISTFLITGLTSMVDSIDDAEWQHAQVLGMNKYEAIWHVVILDRLDYIIDIARQNIAITFMMIVQINMISYGHGGIGTLYRDAQRFSYSDLFVLQMITLTMAILIDVSIHFFRKQTFRYTF